MAVDLAQLRVFRPALWEYQIQLAAGLLCKLECENCGEAAILRGQAAYSFMNAWVRCSDWKAAYHWLETQFALCDDCFNAFDDFEDPNDPNEDDFTTDRDEDD